MFSKPIIEHKIINQGAYNLHYYVSGNPKGECIVFFHPAFADHRCFNRQLDAFLENYRIITIDMLGHGLSQPNKTKDKIDKTTYCITQILEIEQIDKIHLVGVSLGSLIAQHFAIMHPEKALSLTVMGGYDISANNSEINKAQRSEGLKWMIKALFSMNSFRNYVSKVTVSSLDAQAEVYEMTMCFKRKSFMYMSSMGNVVKQRDGVKVQCPLLILVGEKDIELAQRHSKAFHESMPESKFFVISNAGHCANMDNPKEFNAILMDFIA